MTSDVKRHKRICIPQKKKTPENNNFFFLKKRTTISGKLHAAKET